jgi:coenzyme F420 biosynthesis associated uncharacterized protein
MAKLIEPRLALAVARTFTGDTAGGSTYLAQRLLRDLTVAVPRSEELVAAHSGIPAPAPVRWGVVDRATWVEANIRGMNTMIAPLAERIGKRMDTMPLPTRWAQTAVVSAEVGALLGFVSRRVLGQYDLLVAEDDVKGTPLYFVGINMVETVRRHGFVPEEFALWVALHEITHRFQFEGVPWLRQHFIDLVHSYLRSVELDAKTFSQRLAGALRRLRSSDTPPEEKSPVFLLASDEQRALLSQIQALMAVVEGHGNYVMDAIGKEVIPSFERMRAVFSQRSDQSSFFQKVIGHAIGLEMKLRQYELGQQFCDAVVARDGHSALSRLWTDPDRFPSMEELRDPQRWLSRVAA